jgi:hypothetical protein
VNTTIIWIVYGAVLVVLLAAAWRIFTKAGEKGWKVLIPIYNWITLLKIVGRPWWFVLLWLIPFVNFVVWVIVAIDLAKSFGRGIGFAIGLILLFFIFAPILAFGGDRYQGPAARAPAVV